MSKGECVPVERHADIDLAELFVEVKVGSYCGTANTDFWNRGNPGEFKLFGMFYWHLMSNKNFIGTD